MVVEDHETANEKLRAANEEILASNEELQSANEELETSREELQSSNEELITTNEEMQNRNAEISTLNNDFVNLLSSVHMPVVMMDCGLVIRRVTAHAEKVLNITPSDIGRPINKIRLSVEIQNLEKRLSEVIESLAPQSLEIQDKEGTWYLVYLKPYRTMDNKIDGVVMIFVDINDRKKAEMAASHLKAVVESAEDAVISKDLSGIITTWNPGAERMFGYTVSEIVGTSIMRLIPADRRQEENLILDKIKQGKVMAPFDTVRQKRDGGSIEVSVTASPIKDATGKIIGVSKIVRDITERRKAEEKLRESERKMHAVFDQSFQFIGMTTTDGTLIEANRTAMQFAGINESDCLGKPFWDTPWWTHSTEMQNKIREAIIKATGGETVRFEATHPAADGSIHYIDFSLKPIKDETGKVIFLIPEGRDITENKLAEEEAQKRLQELEVFYKASVGREERILELKKEIEQLRKKLGKTL